MNWVFQGAVLCIKTWFSIYVHQAFTIRCCCFGFYRTQTYKIEELTELIKRVYQVRFKAEEDRTSVEVLRVSSKRETIQH